MTETTAPTPVAVIPEAGNLPRPRIRIGAVIWGLLLVGVAALVLWLALSPARRADALEAILGLDAFGWTVAITIAVGGVVTLLALAAVIRRLQTRRHPDARTLGV